MSQSVKSHPFDLRMGDKVQIIAPGETNGVPGQITMAAAPVYEVDILGEFALAVGAPVRCEPENSPRKTRILASVIGNDLGRAKLWITAMEIKVGKERAKRLLVSGQSAEASGGLGKVKLHDVSATGLSFLSGSRVLPGTDLDIEVASKGGSIVLKVQVVHVSQDVGVQEAVVGCKVVEVVGANSEAWADHIKSLGAHVPMAKAS